MLRRVLPIVIVCAAGGAFAEDQALILGNDRYEQLGRVSRGGDAIEAQAGLQALGFTVQQLRNGRTEAMTETLTAFSDGAEGADRLVVILTGRFATNGTMNWFLGAQTTAPTLLTLGQTAVSVDAMMALLASAPGEALLLIGVEQPRGDNFDPWIREGLARMNPPQGVTVVTGSPRDISEFATSDLIVAGADLTEALADWSGLTVSGFAPREWRLMPETATATPTVEPVLTVDPSAEDTLWEGAVALDTVDAYRNYLNRFPDGRYVAEAEKVIGEIISEPNRTARMAEDLLALTRDQRREIQRDLSILDYNTRGVDGIFGSGSRRAIANWQQVNGFGQTTYLTTEQINRLDAQATRRAAEIEAEAERKRREEARLDRAYWDETGGRNDEPGYRAYLSKYPDGLFSQLATERLAAIETQKRAAAEAEDKASWDRARAQNVIASYQDYLQAYPEGVFKAEALAQIAALTQASTDEVESAGARSEEAALNLNPITSRLIEARLGQLGLEPGAVDGQFDPATRRALRRYQRDRDLPVTGYLNEATLVRLLADTVVGVGR